MYYCSRENALNIRSVCLRVRQKGFSFIGREASKRQEVGWRGVAWWDSRSNQWLTLSPVYSLEGWRGGWAKVCKPKSGSQAFCSHWSLGTSSLANLWGKEWEFERPVSGLDWGLQGEHSWVIPGRMVLCSKPFSRTPRTRDSFKCIYFLGSQGSGKIQHCQ